MAQEVRTFVGQLGWCLVWQSIAVRACVKPQLHSSLDKSVINADHLPFEPFKTVGAHKMENNAKIN